MEEHSTQSMSSWVSFFKGGLAVDDAEEEVLQAFLYHLLDLGVFELAGENLLKLSGEENFSSQQEINKHLSGLLDALCEQEAGYFVNYFLPHKSKSVLDKPLPDFSAGMKSGSKNEKSQPEGNTSDLSNLQIVKKMGRQLHPFLEMESRLVSHLTGKYTTRDDAKKIFHFVFGKIQKKAQPKQWEQLSRRRHK